MIDDIENLRFTEDQPITKHAQDVLGRSEFAKNMSQAIAKWKDQESLVIALTGAWGSGKSSIKNLIIEDFINLPNHDIVEFNPWEWGAQEKVSGLFFDEVSLAIQRKDKSKSGKKLAKALRRYSRRINSSATVIDNLTKYLPMLLGSALVTNYLSSWTDRPVAQMVLSFISAISALATLPILMKKFAKALGDHADSVDKSAKDDELTLGEIRKEISDLLSQRDYPLLIIMDDIDRLASDQMRALFQVVKGNMQFPNVVFLLLFQRDIVEIGLQRAGFNGAEYLEKIIQVPFSVPKIPLSNLEAVLFGRLDEVLAAEPQLASQFDQNRWAGIYRHGIKFFFRTLRDVYRYTSTVKFHCRLLRGKDVAEINAVDLFALECLRVFAPSTYEAISQNKELLTRSQQHMAQSRDDKERIGGLVQKMIDCAPEAHRIGTEATLKRLFPNLDWVFNNTTHGGSAYMQWMRESRVCCPDYFTRYFELGLSSDDASNSQVQLLVQLLPNPKEFCEKISAYGADQQNAIMQKLEYRLDDFPLDHSESVLRTLLLSGEILSAESTFVTFSGSFHAYRLLRFFLARHDDQGIRSLMLLNAFRETKGFSVIANVLISESNARTQSETPELNDEVFEALKQEFCQSLMAHADSNPVAFLSHPSFLTYAYRLNRFAKGAGKEWIIRNIISEALFLLLARGLMTKTEASTGEIISTYYSIRFSDLDDLFGIDACQKWLKQVDKTNLSDPKDLEALGSLNELMARYAAGEFVTPA